VALYLDEILVTHRARAADDQRTRAELEVMVDGLPETRDFVGALTSSAPIAVIAEIKRRSPSRGPLAEGLDPVTMAHAYWEGGAACLSVLTDAQYFGGSPADLVEAHAATSIPVLRKDFTVSAADVFDARAMGADAVLLIVAALSFYELGEFIPLAERLGLAALVEVHDETELERALTAGARLIGVNQRDLRTFEVDTNRAVALAKAMPEDVIAVAESGIRTGQDLARLAEAGFAGALIGETLVTSGDPAVALSELLAVAAGL
jgi:indole-3-glycerol phosphate synthase